MKKLLVLLFPLVFFSVVGLAQVTGEVKYLYDKNQLVIISTSSTSDFEKRDTVEIPEIVHLERDLASLLRGQKKGAEKFVVFPDSSVCQKIKENIIVCKKNFFSGAYSNFFSVTDSLFFVVHDFGQNYSDRPNGDYDIFLLKGKYSKDTLLALEGSLRKISICSTKPYELYIEDSQEVFFEVMVYQEGGRLWLIDRSEMDKLWTINGKHVEIKNEEYLSFKEFVDHFLKGQYKNIGSPKIKIK